MKFPTPKCLLLSAVLPLLIACNNSDKTVTAAAVQESREAKKMLQGIWLDDAEGSVSLMARGDTIFYPDSTSLPVYFQIIEDTLVLQGSITTKYPIVKQAPHLFVFRNQNGDEVKLVKSSDPDDKYAFESRPNVTIHQRELVKSDTIVMIDDDKYHAYVQVNPTSYKVTKTSYNDDGVAVDNVYYDNIIHLSVFQGARQLYSHDFTRKDFAKQVPNEVLRQSVLSDLDLIATTPDALLFRAMLAIPDSPSSYLVDINMKRNGKISMKLAD